MFSIASHLSVSDLLYRRISPAAIRQLYHDFLLPFPRINFQSGTALHCCFSLETLTLDGL
jgi:hypothetical protein